MLTITADRKSVMQKTDFYTNEEQENMSVYVVTFCNGLIYGIYTKRESAKSDAGELFEKIIGNELLNDDNEVEKYFHEDDMQICFSAYLKHTNIHVNVYLIEVNTN